jgi:hypothetical protein
MLKMIHNITGISSSVSLRRKMLQYVPADAGFLCNETDMLRYTIKDTL